MVFDFTNYASKTEAVVEGFLAVVTAPNEEVRRTTLRVVELLAVYLPGLAVDRAKERVESLLDFNREMMAMTALWFPDSSVPRHQLRWDGERWHAVTTVRILEPVDPRAVWDALGTILEAPVDREWTRFAPGSEEMGVNGVWYAKSEEDLGFDPIGAPVLAVMHYGGEGSALDDSDCTDWPDWMVPPPGFVDIHLINGDRDRHEEFADKLTDWAGGTTATCDYYTGYWSVRTTRSSNE